MIIECDQCNTKFRLDDSRISPNGVKVRCTKCQNVFIVTPPPPPEEVHVEEVFGADTPFGRPGPEEGGLAGGQSQEEAGEPQRESSDWGVFNTEDEGDEGESKAPEESESPRRGSVGDMDLSGAEDIKTPEDEGGDIEDGNQEPPDLSFGGPDFSTLSGLSGAGPPAEEGIKEEKPAEEEKTSDGPWFTGVAEGTDDGFPEDGPAGTPASGEAPDADEPTPPATDDYGIVGNEPTAGEEGPLDEGFDISAGKKDEEGGKAPFDAFDFGMDEDEQAALEDTPGANGKDELEGAKADGDEREEADNAPGEEGPGKEDDGFSLSPPPEAPAKQNESAGAEKVIPFSTGYNRNGKTAPKPPGGGGDENRFEDLFSRTLSETDTRQANGEEAGGTEGDGAKSDEELEFDRDDLPDETAPEEEERRPQAHGYPAGRGLMLVVLIFILGAGAIYFSGIIDTLARKLTATAPAEVVEIETIKGYVAANKNFGRFFVVEARIKNTSNSAQTIERITGVIYDDRGKSIATRSVSPGRVVGEDDLKNLTKGELLAQFSDSSGGVIPPKGTVPVMVPFTEIPAGMAEFGLKIIRE